MQPPGPQMQDATREIEYLKGIVERYFKVYETKLNIDAVSFHCDVKKETLDENFRRLREELSAGGYTPVITYQRGEYILTIGKLPHVGHRGISINIILLALTIITTILAGMIFWKGYVGENSGPFFTLDSILMGALTFALPLMAILGIHEMGHYFVAKRHGIPASLPYFIPLPPITQIPLGTFGAFISIRGPIPDRRTLFDLGVAGPIAGFIVTIPIAIIGIMLTASGAKPEPAETAGMFTISYPLIYDFIKLFLPMPQNVMLHPTAMAGWIGFLVTAINLLPAGSLDGGHVARAAFGPDYKYASWAAIFAMFVIGFLWYPGWLLFGIVILFLGVDHAPPLNDITKISPRRKLIGLGIAAILVTSFVVIPFEEIPSNYDFDASIVGSNQANVSIEMNHTFTILLSNNGNVNNTLAFDLQPTSLNANVSLDLTYHIGSFGVNQSATNNQITVPVNESATAYVSIILTHAIQQTATVNGSIAISAVDATDVSREIPIKVTEVAGNFSYTIVPSSLAMGGNETEALTVNITSEYPFVLPMRITVIAPAGWSAWAYDADPANATNRLDMLIDAMQNASFTVKVQSPVIVTPGGSANLSIEFFSPSLTEIRTAQIQITIV